MKVRSIHPFPARMAPDLALVPLENLPVGSTVLDPMMGSGTVVQHALDAGHDAVGCDLDPLAVLMSRAWTTAVSDDDIGTVLAQVLALVARNDDTVPVLEWQADTETAGFVDFWFYEAQRADLARIAHALDTLGRSALPLGHAAALDVLRVAFSRIIITKE